MTGQDPRQKVLLVAIAVTSSPVGGRAQLSQLNRDVLKALLPGRLLTIELSRTAGTARLPGALAGYIDGVSTSSIEAVIGTIQSESVRKIYLDGSNLGTLAKAIGSRYPDAEIYTFFHNCEAKFFWGAMRQQLSLRALGVMIANYFAERNAVRFSTKVICLCDRDSRTLLKLYRRAATDIVPMAVRDLLPAGEESGEVVADEEYALFVGGSFYANRAGIAWFARHVAPYVRIKIYVVGKGFELFKKQLERYDNVRVIGEVEALAPWYLGARFVIAPIFDGSGMKTKVAEALMFGKSVIGTPEAFVGYEDVYGTSGIVCRTATDFVQAIQKKLGEKRSAFNPDLRRMYEKHYSASAARDRLATILGIRESHN